MAKDASNSIESKSQGGGYIATPEELRAIDAATVAIDAGEIAADAEVQAAFAKFRAAKLHSGVITREGG